MTRFSLPSFISYTLNFSGAFRFDVGELVVVIDRLDIERRFVRFVDVVKLELSWIGALVLVNSLFGTRLKRGKSCQTCSSWAAGTNCGMPLAATIAERSAGSTITFRSGLVPGVEPDMSWSVKL